VPSGEFLYSLDDRRTDDKLSTSILIIQAVFSF